MSKTALVPKSQFRLVILGAIVAALIITGIFFVRHFHAAQNPGDVNGDGVVNSLDLSIIASNLGKTSQTFAEGDLNGDGIVDTFDLSILASAWQTGTAPTNGTAPATPAATGADICPGGTQSGQLIAPAKYQSQPTLAQVQTDFPAVTNLVIVSGDISQFDLATNTAFWFTPGVHAIHHQIFAAQNDVFIGGTSNGNPAIIDGGNASTFSFVNSNSHPFDHVTIEYLTIRNYTGLVDSGVINQQSGPYWTITHDTVGPNYDGAAIEAGAHETVSYNCITQNGQYGINGYDSQGGTPMDTLTINHNEFDTNDVRTIPASAPLGAGCTHCGYDNYPTPTTRNQCNNTDHPGCPDVYDNGASGGMKLWDDANVTVANNYIHGNHNVGIWADGNNVGVDIENNYISDNWAEGIFYEISYNPTIKNNTLARNAIVEGPRLSGSACCGSFPVGAIYLSESGWDARVDHYCPTTCGSANYGEISGNDVVDNWSGLIAWENADRYCSNFQCGFSSTKQMYSSGATPDQCTKTVAQGGIEPSWDCRWNVQNLDIAHNTFQFDRTNVNNAMTNLATHGDALDSSYPVYTNVLCTATHYCAEMATVSQASSTSWWPADTIACAVTFGSRHLTGGTDNALTPSLKFHDNTYIGSWLFDSVELNQSGGGATIPFAQWTTAVGSAATCGGNENHLAQDAGSTSQ